MGVDKLFNIQGKLRLALGSIKDQASIGRAIITNPQAGKCFSDIEIAVVRATGHDQAPVQDKYVHEILFLVSNVPASAPFLADKISRRLAKTRDPLVAAKTLVLIHRLLRGGNRGFEQGLRNAYFSGHLKLNSLWFSDGHHQSFTSFLHNYASYLEERIGWVINQAGKLEPDWSSSKSKRPDLDQSSLLTQEKISLLWRCQDLMERILRCWPEKDAGFSSENSVLARTAMSNTLKESFQVQGMVTEGMETLLDVFFDLTRESRALACEILKRGSRQSRRLYEMYEECKRSVMAENKNLEYPKVKIIAMDHVVALEQCIGDQMQQVTTTSRGILPPPRRVGGAERAPLNLFSWRLETKISKIWVVFEDDEESK